MLPHEIEPFADHHIAKLLQISDYLHPEKAGDRPIEPLDEEAIYEIVNGARRALDRFKACMADEVKQKERYRTYAKDHGYPYS